MEENRPGYYAVIPADVRYDQNLPPNAKLLYGEISALIGKDGYCFASNSYFADIYGVTVKSISRLVAALEDCGYIVTAMDRDKTGQIVRRKIYLKVSVPDIQPVDNFVHTPPQNCPGGIDNFGEYTNTSNTNIKDAPVKKSRPSLTDDQLREHILAWITKIGASWPSDCKNKLYQSLTGFYAPRQTKRETPARTQAAFTALTNKLLTYAAVDGAQPDPMIMVDMLDRATLSSWRSVFPPNGNRRPEPKTEEQWL